MYILVTHYIEFILAENYDNNIFDYGVFRYVHFISEIGSKINATTESLLPDE